MTDPFEGMHSMPAVLMTPEQKAAAEKYRPDFAAQARKFALLGAKDSKIAEFLGVKLHTLMLWREIFPEFAGSLDSGGLLADADVAYAVYRRAIGYSHPATKFFGTKIKDEDGNETFEIHEQTYMEHYPPDVGAAQFWLTNRAPEQWKNSSHQKVDSRIELTGSGLSGLIEATQKLKNQAPPSE